MKLCLRLQLIRLTVNKRRRAREAAWSCRPIVADEAQPVAILELEIEAIERPHDYRPVVRRKFPAERLVETQLQRLRGRVDDREVDNDLLQADPCHRTGPSRYIQKMMRRR